jgi:Ca2+-binding RTX toxin-like protein
MSWPDAYVEYPNGMLLSGICKNQVGITMATITGTNLDDIINGTASADSIYGLDGDDELYGADGNDSIEGGNGADFLGGDAGNDTVNGGAGDDELYGADGDDVYFVDDAGDLVYEFTSNTGYDEVYSSVSFSVNNFGAAAIEDLYLTGTTNINGTGNAQANFIQGTIGNNVLDGKAGADSLAGDNGDDSVAAGTGNDIVNAGDGNGADTRCTVPQAMTRTSSRAPSAPTTTTWGSPRLATTSRSRWWASFSPQVLSGNATLIAARDAAWI